MRGIWRRILFIFVRNRKMFYTFAISKLQDMRKVVVQEIVKVVPDVAERYFRILSAINNLGLTDREINLLAYIANNGLTDRQSREEFCKKYNTTLASIYNVVSNLKKMGMVTKDKDGTRMVAVLDFDYKKDVRLHIELRHE